MTLRILSYNVRVGGRGRPTRVAEETPDRVGLPPQFVPARRALGLPDRPHTMFGPGSNAHTGDAAFTAATASCRRAMS